MPGFAPTGGAPVGAPGGTSSISGGGGGTTYDEVLVDGIGVGEVVGAMSTGNVTYDVVISSGINLPDDVPVIARRFALAVDDATTADAVLVYPGARVFERLRLADRMKPTQIAQVMLADALRLRDSFAQMFAVELAESALVGDTTTAQQLVRLVDELALASSLQPTAHYNLALTQAFRLGDQLRLFLGGSLEDTVELQDDYLHKLLAIATAVDSVEVSSSVVPQLLIAAKVADSFAIEKLDAVQMLFNPTLLDGVEISAGYIAPNGSFTTWVMNTRSGAVTEYADFVFNSFARMGNKYLGASDAGLYELLGDDDAGADILARVRSGFMQFGGTQLSRLKAAYVAMRGEGDIILKIITAEDEVYHYETSTRNMRSTKVHMGKGQRSRYFAFELITAGQDFDLDTIEFVPIVVQRRV